jgi:catechol 2,3-dioxygenase-like lactoylglutathione lyase family enzyme
VIPIKRLFEAHIIVRDLQRSVAFYRDVLGLQVGIEQPERPAAFFWVGGRGKSMLGIFTLGSWPTQMMQHHLSFRVTLEDSLSGPAKTAICGHNPEGTPHSELPERRTHRRADRVCLDAGRIHNLR